jgi:hypothetical protein
MTEVTEFETRTHWQPNRLRTVEDGLYSEPSVPEVKSLLGQETWASLRRNSPGVLPISDSIIGSRQISHNDGLSAGMDRWDFVYGLLQTPASNDHVTEVEMPLDQWFWCGDPAVTLRICLKKRMSILSHFDG